jgi:ABC-type Mn2+/Zn2+ transport system permease subunit
MDFVRSIPLLSSLLLVERNGMTFLDALPILQNGILAGLLVALVSAFLGVYVILKRIVFVSAAISQISSLGVACAFLVATLLGHHASEVKSQFLSGPGLTSVVFACLAALFLARQVSEKRITRESILGIGYVLPAGLTLVVLDLLSAEAHAIEDILFGNSVFVSVEQLRVQAVTAVVVLLIHLLLYKEFIFTSLDPETATACGMRTRLFNRILLLTIAFTIAVSIMSIGALPVFAFMVIPASGALTLTERLGPAFFLSVAFGVSAALVGFYLSFVFSLPTGPVMLATAGLFLIPGGARTLLHRWRLGVSPTA